MSAQEAAQESNQSAASHSLGERTGGPATAAAGMGTMHRPSPATDLYSADEPRPARVEARGCAEEKMAMGREIEEENGCGSGNGKDTRRKSSPSLPTRALKKLSPLLPNRQLSERKAKAPRVKTARELSDITFLGQLVCVYYKVDCVSFIKFYTTKLVPLGRYRCSRPERAHLTTAGMQPNLPNTTQRTFLSVAGVKFKSFGESAAHGVNTDCSSLTENKAVRMVANEVVHSINQS